jgi:hypothetical protein
MKKLLALILCVMMFVSIVPTAAFAADRIDPTDQRVWAGASQQKKIVDALRSNVEAMYGSYAVDNAVFSSVKTIDGILTDLVDEMLKNYSSNDIAPGLGTTTSSSDLNDAIVAGLRSTVGGSISDYLNKHQNEYYTYDGAGHKVFNPSAYAGVYAKAASDALTSEKAVAGIQAVMLYAASRSAFNELAMEARDLRNDITSWEHWGDYGFGDSLSGNNFIRWHVADNTANNIDHVLNGITGNYATVLSALGQIGVNLDQSAQPVPVFKDADGKVYRSNVEVQYDAATGKIIGGIAKLADGTTKTVTYDHTEYVPTFDLGYEGWIVDADGNLQLSQAAKGERVNSALIDTYYGVAKGGAFTFVKDPAKADYIVKAYEQAGEELNLPNRTLAGITWTDPDNKAGADSFNWAEYDYNDGTPITQDITNDAFSYDMWYNTNQDIRY